MRIVETDNARFLENGEISRSNEPRKVDVEEIRVHIPPLFYLKKLLSLNLFNKLRKMSNIIEMAHYHQKILSLKMCRATTIDTFEENSKRKETCHYR